jgi:hypothetical protein
MGRITNFFSETITVVGGMVAVYVIGIYLASTPRSYSRQTKKLLPPTRRKRASETFSC